MVKLHELKRNPKSKKSIKRVGRGFGSGHGRQSTRGAKGQKSRTGHSKMPARFEGGRQPLIRQVPKKRGFKSIWEHPYGLSLTDLNIFNDGDRVNLKALKEKELVGNRVFKVKILKGEIKKKLEVKLPVSESAKKSIEAAGGRVI